MIPQDQLDIACAVQRLEQILDDPDSPMADMLIQRVLHGDLPRLKALLSPETLVWMEYANA